MTGQLSFFAVPVPTDPGLPALPTAIQEILDSARSISFATRIVRGTWGVGINPPRRRWVLKGDCCCALGAFLVVKGADFEKGTSATSSVASLLGVDQLLVVEFTNGFDGKSGAGQWFEYGQRVARELGVK